MVVMFRRRVHVESKWELGSVGSSKASGVTAQLSVSAASSEGKKPNPTPHLIMDQEGDSSRTSSFDSNGERDTSLFFTSGRRATGQIVGSEADRYVNKIGGLTLQANELPGVTDTIITDGLGDRRTLVRLNTDRSPLQSNWSFQVDLLNPERPIHSMNQVSLQSRPGGNGGASSALSSGAGSSGAVHTSTTAKPGLGDCGCDCCQPNLSRSEMAERKVRVETGMDFVGIMFGDGPSEDEMDGIAENWEDPTGHRRANKKIGEVADAAEEKIQEAKDALAETAAAKAAGKMIGKLAAIVEKVYVDSERAVAAIAEDYDAAVKAARKLAGLKSEGLMKGDNIGSFGDPAGNIARMARSPNAGDDKPVGVIIVPGAIIDAAWTKSPINMKARFEADEYTDWEEDKYDNANRIRYSGKGCNITATQTKVEIRMDIGGELHLYSVWNLIIKVNVVTMTSPKGTAASRAKNGKNRSATVQASLALGYKREYSLDAGLIETRTSKRSGTGCSKAAAKAAMKSSSYKTTGTKVVVTYNNAKRKYIRLRGTKGKVLTSKRRR